MDRVFLDANVLFSAAYRVGPGLLELWRLKNVELWTSGYAFEEARVNLPEQQQRERLEKLATKLHIIDVVDRHLPRGIHLPEKDAPILTAAIEVQATHLLTGDLRHFGPYFGKRVGSVLVLTPAEYLTRAKSN